MNLSIDLTDIPIKRDLTKNKETINELFSAGINMDFACTDLLIKSTRQKASLFFYSSIVDHTIIQQSIIRPLLEAEPEAINITTHSRSRSHIKDIITVDKIETVETFQQAASSINQGKVVLFVENHKEAYALNVAKFEHRSVEKPENENVVKGPKEAFTESLAVNLSLLRKRTHDNDLIAEAISVGERSKLNVAVLYIKNITNEDLLENVRGRLKSIDVDTVRNLELLEQYIEERPYSLISTLLYTERPDRAAHFLENGYVVLLMENSSACLILPATFWSFFHTPEDHYLRFLFGNFSRFIRMAALFITLFISAIYIAITNYHSEMVPMDLLLAMASARERVPFPAVIEVFVMEFAFELIREAGLRIPSPLGPTIGIVGAIIIGQAAVQANVISPIIIIVVSLSGLSSFTVSDVSFNYTIRLSRFIFIGAAYVYGIYSLTGVFLLWVMYLTSIKSFGVPFLSPVSPHTKSSNNTFFKPVLKKEKFRPGFLSPLDLRKKK